MSDDLKNDRFPKRAWRRSLRLSSAFAVFLGAVLACLVIALGYRFNLTWEVPVGSVRLVSERTRAILADTQGTIRIFCFMDRRHPMFRPLSRLLRGLRQASRSVAGADIVVEYVDPRWDLTRAGQLVASGVPENAVLLERQRRRVVITLDDMVTTQSPLRQMDSATSSMQNRSGGLGVFRGEMACASAIARLSLPFERLTLYWLQGHGEARFDNYDDLRGFSDIAREIKRDGYEIQPLELPGRDSVPPDCHVLMIAGAQRRLAPEELKLIDAFLQGGGRLLCLVSPHAVTGLEPLLEKWGIRLTPFVAVSPKTLTGDDVVVTSFADHIVTRNLRNVSLVFGTPICLEAVSDASKAGEVDRPKVMLIASTDSEGWGESHPDVYPRHFDAQGELKGPVSVVAVSERGGSVSKDVAYKPTRLCVIGETDFIMNGALASRANANRDLLMNALSWLAGIDTGTATSLGGDASLVTGFSRKQWISFAVWSTVFVPLAFFAVFMLVSFRTRN